MPILPGRGDPDGATGPLRLAPGEYVPPHGWVERLAARRLFLDALADVEPRVLSDLAGEPLARFRRRLGDAAADPPAGRPDDPVQAALAALARVREHDGRAAAASAEAFETVAAEDANARPDEIAAAADAALTSLWTVAMIEWGGRWRLDRGFVMDVAAYTLASWAVAPPATDERLGFRWFLAADDLLLDRPEPPVLLSVDAWAPRREPRGAARERMLREAATAVDRAMADAERRGAAAGLIAAPVKRTGDEHFRWLVRYQVRGESFAAIARGACRGRQAVAEAVKETAALVGLPLRPPDPPGRPRASRPARIVRVERPPR